MLMDPKIKDLILLFTDAELILMEIRDLKANLSLELQAIRDERRALRKEFDEIMKELRETVTQLRALHQINMRVLNLINAPEKAREQKNETGFTTRFTQ